MSERSAAVRQPLEAAPMIPRAAAGRQPLFFFGTLMDLDVLTYVLQRPVDLDDVLPARVDGFVRRRRGDASGTARATRLLLGHG